MLLERCELLAITPQTPFIDADPFLSLCPWDTMTVVRSAPLIERGAQRRLQLGVVVLESALLLTAFGPTEDVRSLAAVARAD